MNVETLIRDEGWKIHQDGKKRIVEVYGQKFPIIHPFAIHSKLYTDSGNPAVKYTHLKRMHDMLWPRSIWHYWTERRFKEHCEGWKYITWAGGASTGKSYDGAKLAILFWAADPQGRSVIVASTTLTSLESRIWGYVSALIHEMELPLQFRYMRAQPPRILYDKKDTIHGMFTLAAAKGKSEDSSAIKSYIGRHPKRGMMIMLDEATDLDPAILEAIPNLEASQEVFQCVAIGNSNSKFDLHGLISTPENGWNSVRSDVDLQWRTTQTNGTCLFFPCWDSPAIHEIEPEKKRQLSKFLITEEAMKAKKKLYGEKSPSYWRFVLGFWKEDTADETVISEKFLSEFNAHKIAEWSGLHKLHVCGGLDPAFSSGGDQCILQLAILGQDTNGKIVLDFRGNELTFPIKLDSKSETPLEIQIAEEVIKILNLYQCPLSHIAVDANGQGRALPELIRLKMNVLSPPLKIQSRKAGLVKKQTFDIINKTTYELWAPFRDFIQTDQIRGLGPTVMHQLTSRMVEIKNGKPVLEEKHAYKSRMGAISPTFAHSPDQADSCALAIQAAIMRFGFHPGQEQKVTQETNFADKKFLAYKAFMEGQKAEAEKKKHILPSYSGDIFSYLDHRKPF